MLSEWILIANEFYLQRVGSLDARIEEAQTLSRRLSIARGALGLPGLGLIVLAFFDNRMPWGSWQLGSILLFAFLVAATWQEAVLARIDRLLHQRIFYRRMLARERRAWSELPPLPTEEKSLGYQSELTRDLDIFGDRSLFRWLSLAVTDSGAATLAAWLTHWEESSVLRERQLAVQELAADREWRQRFWDTATGFRGGATNPEWIAGWGMGNPHFEQRRWLAGLTWVGPILFLVCAITLAFTIPLGYTALAAVAFFLGIGALVLNLVLTVFLIGPIHDIFVKIGGANHELQALHDLVEAIELRKMNAPLLVRLRAGLGEGETRASKAIVGLRRRMRFAGLQRNPLFFLPYLLLQLSVLWDIRVLTSLEQWRTLHGGSLGTWIGALAQFEVLTSAAAVADEQPDWSYPVWNDSPHRELSITSLEHPLIPVAARVGNDLRMEDAKPLLLVTGSNMAGKSTLLRSLGINTIASRIGAPVACRSWSSPNFEVASSIRVQDSLQDGVSFFMAELKRLRNVVDAARAQRDLRGVPMLVLLDEILQGTNSRERQIAVESVLEQLVRLHCMVVTSTHDLELASVESIVRSAQIVHFREFFETIDGHEVMRFDYRMRPGVTPTTNALKLLAMVGLADTSSK